MSADFLAWAVDTELRRNGSSGGFVRAMLGYLLHINAVDHALVARTGGQGLPFAPGFVLIQDPEELRSRHYCSVYYPVDHSKVWRLAGKRYGVTLLPCQAEGDRPSNHAWIFELLCGGVPNPAWTRDMLNRVGANDPTDVFYRGNGWPGTFQANGQSVPWQSEWDRKNLLPECQNCHRACSENADFTCADPWGLRPRLVGAGKTLVRSHTPGAEQLVVEAVKNGVILIEPDGGLMSRRLKAHAKRQ